MCNSVDAEEFGGSVENRLKQLRLEQGWSQSELGKHLDVSRQTINALEKGRYDPSLPLAFRIARIFGLKIEEVFLDGADEKGTCDE